MQVNLPGIDEISSLGYSITKFMIDVWPVPETFDPTLHKEDILVGCTLISTATRERFHICHDSKPLTHLKAFNIPLCNIFTTYENAYVHLLEHVAVSILEKEYNVNFNRN
jgi:hypothetical protein